jgi:hypothetical protein
VNDAPQKDMHTHELIRVNVPAEGYMGFICSSAPANLITVYEEVARCPLCMKINPLGEGR